MTRSFADHKACYARSDSVETAAAPAVQPSAPAVTATATLAGRRAASFSAKPNPTPASAIRFDDATHSIVVPTSDGITVTFVGEDVKRLAGFRKLNYIVRHRKSTASRFFEHTLAHSDSTGGSLLGRGEEFPLEDGGIIYLRSDGSR